MSRDRSNDHQNDDFRKRPIRMDREVRRRYENKDADECDGGLA